MSPARHAAGDLDTPLTRAVAAAQKGDDAAFTQVYRAVQPGLLRYLTVLVGADAEDVASETWAQVCRDFSGFQGDGDGFRAWTATIGRHRATAEPGARPAWTLASSFGSRCATSEQAPTATAACATAPCVSSSMVAATMTIEITR